jgi:type IV secretory pathway VirB10-like protein
MARIAVGFSLAFLGTLAAILLYQRQPDAPAPAAAADPQVIERLDRLENAIIQLGARSKPDDPAAPVLEGQTPPLPTPQDEARQSAIRAGNEVVDAAVGAARWSLDDAAALQAATRSLGGADRAAVYARVSAAINADQLSVDPAALRF